MSDEKIGPLSSSGIDWASVHEKLKANQAALEKAFDSDPEHNARIFRQRAERMAARANAARRVETLPVMSFYVGEEKYGILLSELSGVKPFANCTPVPGTPAELCGVVSIRGEIRSVIDLARVIGMSKANDEEGYMLLLKGENASFALRVSRVHQVENIEKSAVLASQTAQTTMLGQYLRGVNEEALVFLNLGQVLGHPIFQGIS